LLGTVFVAGTVLARALIRGLGLVPFVCACLGVAVAALVCDWFVGFVVAAFVCDWFVGFVVAALVCDWFVGLVVVTLVWARGELGTGALVFPPCDD
jgi:hypothetical protein